jgi:hypothetical protein
MLGDVRDNYLYVYYSSKNLKNQTKIIIIIIIIMKRKLSETSLYVEDNLERCKRIEWSFSYSSSI